MVGIIAVFLSLQYQEYEKNKFKNRISSSEVIFENISFNPINNNYEMTGRIINNSEKYTLSGVQLKITVKDCTSDATYCFIISESNEYIYVSIPPMQARDIKKEIYFYSNQRIENKLVWNYSIEYTDSK